MPASEKLTWADGELFAPMGQNPPENDLFMRIRALFPKQQTTALQMLDFIGDDGIGRLGYRLPGADAPPFAAPLTKESLLNTDYSPEVFNDLVMAYLTPVDHRLRHCGRAAENHGAAKTDDSIDSHPHCESGQRRLPKVVGQRVPLCARNVSMTLRHRSL